MKIEAFYQALQHLGYTHPVHPTIIYLPIGGVMTAFIFGMLAVIFNRSSLAVSARHNIVLAFFAVFPTILLGYMDWQYYHGGVWMFPIRMKIYLAIALVILLLITLLSHYTFKAGTKVLIFSLWPVPYQCRGHWILWWRDRLRRNRKASPKRFL